MVLDVWYRHMIAKSIYCNKYNDLQYMTFLPTGNISTTLIDRVVSLLLKQFIYYLKTNTIVITLIIEVTSICLVIMNFFIEWASCGVGLSASIFLFGLYTLSSL